MCKHKPKDCDWGVGQCTPSFDIPRQSISHSLCFLVSSSRSLRFHIFLHKWGGSVSRPKPGISHARMYHPLSYENHSVFSASSRFSAFCEERDMAMCTWWVAIAQYTQTLTHKTPICLSLELLVLLFLFFFFFISFSSFLLLISHNSWPALTYCPCTRTFIHFFASLPSSVTFSPRPLTVGYLSLFIFEFKSNAHSIRQNQATNKLSITHPPSSLALPIAVCARGTRKGLRYRTPNPVSSPPYLHIYPRPPTRTCLLLLLSFPSPLRPSKRHH